MIDTLEIEGLGPIVITEVEIQQVGPAGPNVITDLISAGTNVTFAGSGTLASPYVVSASGGGGGGDGTVTSVGMTVPAGLTVTGTPITESGTLTVTLTAGHVIPTQEVLDSKQPVSRKTFTPASTGWWRVAQHVDVIGCRMSITAPEHVSNPTRTTDIELNVHVNATTRGVMSQLRHSVRGGGHISEVRTARGQDGFVVFDINVTADGSPITLEARGLLFPGFVATPVKIADSIADNGETLLEDLALGNGLRTTGGLIYHLGSARDPGQPLTVNGRAGYVHFLRLAAGSSRFTGGSDHFHIHMSGASAINAQGGALTDQTGQDGAWNSFQQQNSNSPSTNELFAGGVNSFFYGETPFGQATRYGISTDSVETTGTGDGSGYEGPVAPNFSALVDFWFTANTGIPANGTTIMVNFLSGEAGISAAILPGVVESLVQMTTPAPDSTPNIWRMRVRLSGLNAIEWNAAQATVMSKLLDWSASVTPAQIVGNTSLTPHATRRDKVVAVFSEAHGMHLGQAVVLRITDTTWGVSPESYSGCITKVISDTSFEMRIGIARRLDGAELGTREYSTRYSGVAENHLRIPSHPFTHGEPVKLSVIGTMQTGLEEGVTYYVNRTGSSQPNHWIKLFSDVGLTTDVTFTRLSGRGIYFIHRVTALDALGGSGWSIHKGNRDPVHQQTISDVGWSMHRNVFPNRRGLAAGTIAQATLGGLCDIPKWATGSAAVGFDCAAEADFAYAFGRGVRNSTTNSVEIGASDAKKLRITDSGLDVVTDGVAAPLVPDHTGDVTGGTELTIANNAVTNAKLADMPTGRIKARLTADTGDPEDLTAAEARTLLNVADGATANATNAQLRDRATHTGRINLTIVNDTSTAYLLDAASAYPNYIRCNNADAITLTLEAGQTGVAGRHWIIRQIGAGAATLALVDDGDNVVTVNGERKTAGQHTEIAVILVADNVVDVMGGVA